ncbi:DNA alkylation repair enzyme [Eubacterium nodatum ATCC 33099]|nr:DNA alkylation repair enzyme [Eubacterium nodatum ATCC 33099]
MDILKELLDLREEEYADFQSRLTPGIDRERFIGVRIPKLRKLAGIFKKTTASKEFLGELPHYYFEENMLHGLLIAEIKDYDMCIAELEKFLPFIDNWAVCDVLSPKVFKKHKTELFSEIRKWSDSKDTYICRFGIGMLMRYFLDEDFTPEHLKIPANIHSEEYYVNMMLAWYFATALAKQWKDTIVLLETGALDKWVHNKTIQKARESFRITGGQKEYLKGLKRI